MGRFFLEVILVVGDRWGWSEGIKRVRCDVVLWMGGGNDV